MKNVQLLLILGLSAAIPGFAVPPAGPVISTTDTSDNDGTMTIEELCKTLMNENNVYGDSRDASINQVECFKVREGLFEIRASNRYGGLSIYANAKDQLNVKLYGDYFYSYSNNLNQKLAANPEFIHTRERKIFDGVLEEGYYRVELTLWNGDSKIHVGVVPEFESNVETPNP